MLIIKIILILAFLLVFYQDTKERLVWWFLFPIIGILCGVLNVFETSFELFLYSTLINSAFILVLLTILYLYAKLKMNLAINKTIGLGDVLLFFALTCSFALISFITLFVFSLVFALLLHLLLSRDKRNTVALAGYMSLFFAISYLAYWLNIITNLYSL